MKSSSDSIRRGFKIEKKVHEIQIKAAGIEVEAVELCSV
jgi:hypothetical protein